MQRKNALIIFCKAPYPGKVKTRMQPQLTAEQSCDLYKAMVEDLVQEFRTAQSFDLHIHFWPPEAETEMRGWLGSDLEYAPQHTGDLGDKMHLSIRDLLKRDYEKVAIIGSDLPTLICEDIEQAFDLLDTNDAVFGPTDDGGYYLIALNNAHPILFKDVIWSSETVFSQTLRNAQLGNIRIGQLAQKSDIDSFKEVKALHKLAATSAYQFRILNTKKILANLFLIL